MSDPTGTAQRAASGLSLPEPWDLFGQRLRRFEVHFDGPHIETVRGPILVEGVSLRVFRPQGDGIGVGVQSTTDLSREGLAQAQESAERVSRHARFPTGKVGLPSGARQSTGGGGPTIVDAKLWDDPVGQVNDFVESLLHEFPRSGDPSPAFGSIKATLGENSIVNSQGLSLHYPETSVELELAVKSAGGPEGPAAGEYWVTREFRELDSKPLRAEVALWCQRAQDVRRAKTPPSGEVPVGLPPALLSEIVPSAMSARFSGAGRRRRIALEPGVAIASPSVSIRHDPTIAWAISSVPFDDEGTAAEVVPLIERGSVTGLIYDCLNASAFELPSNGAGVRRTEIGRRTWLRFLHRPAPGFATLSIAPGGDGSEAELIESIADGLWVDQLGWPDPDATSSAFGGEIRIGYRIRNGRLAEPVRGGTLGGLAFAPPGTRSLLGSVRALGSRATLVGGISTPPMVVDGLTVSGDSERGAPAT